MCAKRIPQLLTALGMLVAMAWTALGWADEIKVKGVVLKGKILAIDSKSVQFETDYGAGTLSIPLADIESISSEKSLHVVHGEEGEAHGRILGYTDGKLLVGDDPATAERIDPNMIHDLDTEEVHSHWYERVRNRYRFWKASLDLGVSFSDETTDETDVTVGWHSERRRGPRRFIFDARYLYGREKPQRQKAVVTDNELTGLLKYEYDFNPRTFIFVSTDLEYDELESLSLRAVGKVGPGYKIVKNEKTTIQLEAGLAYVYRNFFKAPEEKNVAISFGSEGTSKLPLNFVLRYRTDFLPSIEDVHDYLIRGAVSLGLPVTKYLQLKWSIIDVYDNTPDVGNQRNEFEFLFSVAWHL